MSLGNEAKVVITGDDSPLRSTLRSLASHFGDFGRDAQRSVDGVNGPLDKMKDRFNGLNGVLKGPGSALEGLRGALAGLAATLGVLSFGRMVSESIESAAALHDLQQVSGLTVETLSAMSDIGKTSGTDLNQIAAASNKLSKAMSAADEDSAGAAQALKYLGINVREFQGLNADERMLSVAKALAQVESGTDRAAAATALLGKEGAALVPFMMDLASAGDLQARVTAEQAAIADEFGDNLTNLKTTGEAWKKELAMGMLPALNDFAKVVLDVFNETGGLRDQIRKLAADGSLAEWTRSALEGFTRIIDGVQWVARSFSTLTEYLGATAAALKMKLDGASEAAIESIRGDFLSKWDKIWEGDLLGKRIRDGMDRAASEVSKVEIPAPRITGRFNAKAPKDPKDEKEKKDPAERSVMTYYEAALAEQKRVYGLMNDGRELSKQEEVEYWKFLLKEAQMSAGDRANVLKRVATLETDIRKEAAARARQIDEDGARTAETLALAKVDGEAAAARAMLEAKQITQTQAALLEQQFEERRYQIQASALRERLKLLEMDPTLNEVEAARVKNALLVLEQQHANKLIDLQSRVTQARKQDNPLGSFMDSAASGLSSQLDSYLTAMQGWAESLRGIWSSLKQSFIKTMVTEPAMQYLAGLGKMLAAKLGFHTAEQTAQGASSAATVATKTGEATAVIAANAAEAGSGAAASQASIPYVGPILALAAMAAVFAAVSGMSRSMKSARGGFDIPSGMNPMVQTHEEEMILPAHISNGFREIIADQRGGRGGGDVVFAPKGVSAGDFFIIHKRELGAALKEVQRGFHDR